VLRDPRPGALAALFLLLLATGCDTPTAPQSPLGPGPVTTPPPPPNNPPRVLSIALSTDRLEVGEEVTLTAAVSDDETSADDLTYQWDATSGSFSGTGRIVKWKAPLDKPAPATYTITLVVVDAYRSGDQALEHRVTAVSSEIHVDDSPATVRAMALQFLKEFTDNSLTPEYCVREFADSCRGKQRERNDIADVRKDYVIQSSKISVSRVTVDDARTRANVFVSCEFTSTYKPTKATVVAKGTCELQLVNQTYRWWLCESSMHAGNTAALTFPF
jgi:hypothetical protein